MTAQPLTLLSLSLTPGGVLLTARAPDGKERRAQVPRPFLAQLLSAQHEGEAPVYALTLTAAPPYVPRLLAAVRLENPAQAAPLGVTL